MDHKPQIITMNIQYLKVVADKSFWMTMWDAQSIAYSLEEQTSKIELLKTIEYDLKRLINKDKNRWKTTCTLRDFEEEEDGTQQQDDINERWEAHRATKRQKKQ